MSFRGILNRRRVLNQPEYFTAFYHHVTPRTLSRTDSPLRICCVTHRTKLLVTFTSLRRENQPVLTNKRLLTFLNDAALFIEYSIQPL